VNIGDVQHERFSLLTAQGFKLREPVRLDGRQGPLTAPDLSIAGVDLS
jgi:hypothetical protein